MDDLIKHSFNEWDLFILVNFSEHKIYIADRGCNVYITHKDSVDNKFIIPQPLVNMNITKKIFIYQQLEKILYLIL